MLLCLYFCVATKLPGLALSARNDFVRKIQKARAAGYDV